MKVLRSSFALVPVGLVLAAACSSSSSDSSSAATTVSSSSAGGAAGTGGHGEGGLAGAGGAGGAGGAVECPATDACHLPGTFDPDKGMCTNPIDPKALGTLNARCGAMPVLLDAGYGTLGLLPHVKLPGSWNPYLIDGNADASSRKALYARAHAIGLRPYWLAYGNVLEGLSGVERARGKTPNPSDPQGRGLVDECGNATDAGGSVAACRTKFAACGGKVGGSSEGELAATFSDWFADGSLGYQVDSNTHRSAKPTGLLPDDEPVPTIDALQIDLEGECFGELLKPNGDAAEQAKAIDVFGHAFHAIEAGLFNDGIGAGTSVGTKLGLYGIPTGRDRCSPYDDALNNGAGYPAGPLGYWSDECRYLVPQLAPEKCGANPPVRCAPESVTITSVGDGYSALGRLVPWMLFTGKNPWEHPAFTWLPQKDDGNPNTWEADDLLAFANPALRQEALFKRYFEGTGPSTSMATLNRLIGKLPGEVLFPSLYKSAGAVELAWGDVSENEWKHNIVGLGAAAFEHKVAGHADPHVAKVFQHLLLEHEETAQLSNRLLLEVAWGWKVFKGRKLAPIVTVIPGGGVGNKMVRDPSDPTGATVCTADDAILRVDQNLPGRCGDVPPACSIAGYRKQTSLPAHPGRKAIYHTWDAAKQAYVPDEANPEKHTYVMANTEVYAHQSLDEFEVTQVRPMVMAVPHGELDAVVGWPDTTSLAGLCAGQGRRLKYGGGFHYLNAYGGYENTGVPEPLWMRFFAPGPLSSYCHDGHEASCREVLDWSQPCDPGDVCEPLWPSLKDDLAVEELCTEAVGHYALARWERVRKVFEDAQSNASPALAYQPTAFCAYLEGWFSKTFGIAPPKPMCK